MIIDDNAHKPTQEMQLWKPRIREILKEERYFPLTCKMLNTVATALFRFVSLEGS